ncbi:alpha/beta fold hydrolase [Chitinilyticum litopenaei]|uniref:alpha/beta fold hydrolase n=1 Tax=Chitinilyticum litopenaei TaxID=1121276 RepID=UPI000418C2C3|nr:alpha/beta hydrolase [Chitinilyticum litopenaei]
MNRVLQCVLPLLVLLVLSGCAAVPTTARQPLAGGEIAVFSRPGSAPIVVFEAGLGDGKAVWGAVIERLPKGQAVLAYDRPGYGDSAARNGERSPCTISAELAELLAQQAADAPVILVGHSLGGLYAYCFARQYPQRLAGLLLLDPTHPEHWPRIQSGAPEMAALVTGLRHTLFTPAMRQEFDEQALCPQAAARPEPRAVPTVLMFSGRRRPEELGRFQTVLESLRRDWQARLPQAQVLTLPMTGHYIQTEAPERVAASIRTLLAGAGKPRQQQ